MNKRRRFKAKRKRAERKSIHDRMCVDGIHEQRGVFDYDAAIARGWRPTFFTTNYDTNEI